VTRVVIALGSNSGAPKRRLSLAVKQLDKLPQTKVIRASSFYRSKPLGPRQANFLNAAVLIKTGLKPLSLLIELKRLEAIHGRRPGPKWGPRPLDLDLILYGRLRYKSRLLQIPHPEALKRSFVLIPIAEII